MTIHNEQDAIRLAVEAGWNPYTPPARFLSACYKNGWVTNWEGEGGKSLQRWFEADLQQPAFWQALGKARGWDDADKYCTSGCGFNGDCGPENHGGVQCVFDNKTPEWKDHALHYFETLLTAPEKIKEYWTSLP